MGRSRRGRRKSMGGVRPCVEMSSSNSYLDPTTLRAFEIIAVKTRNTKHTASGFCHNAEWVV